jgi:nuclear transcription factor Y gamma
MQAPGAYNNPVAPPPPAAPKKYDGQNGVPLYDASHGGHYGASAAIATAGHAPPPETFSGHWGNVSISIPLRAHASMRFAQTLVY